MLPMSKLLILFLFFIITLASCDGRDHAYKNNEAVLRDSNLLKSFSNRITCNPKQAVEIITDTILSNGFKIKMRYHSVSNDYVVTLNKSENDSTAEVHYHNFQSHFQVSKNNTVIIEDIIDKRLFYEFESPVFWKKAIMQYVWIDYEASSETSLNLKTSFRKPNSSNYKDFSISIYEDGTVAIKEINLHSNTI